VACAASLYKLGQESPAFEVVLQLGKLLESPDGGTRRAAAENLGYLGSPVTIPLLAQAIRDSNSDVRFSAVDGLLNTHSPEAIPILEQAVNDSNREVAEQAREVIARLRSRTDR
jgi:HEAT repeat protein